MNPERGPLAGCEPPISCIATPVSTYKVAAQGRESSKRMMLLSCGRGLRDHQQVDGNGALMDP